MKTKQQKGASLIEVVVVLAIALVLGTAAVSLFGRSTDNFDRQNAARQFKNYLERARFDSVKRRANVASQMAMVRIDSTTQYSYALDLNQNGTLDAGETIAVDIATSTDLRMVGNDFELPVTILFDQRGSTTTTNGDGDEILPLVYFCDGECTPLTATGANSNRVYVSPTGTVAMLKGNEVLPFFTNPTVSTVNSNSSVNPLLVVWEPNPDAEASSTPTPTATPTPTPTATPTPVGTPTPTPTPSQTVCASGQNAIATGCRCVSPMWVRSNGKCR